MVLEVQPEEPISPEDQDITLQSSRSEFIAKYNVNYSRCITVWQK